MFIELCNHIVCFWRWEVCFVPVLNSLIYFACCFESFLWTQRIHCWFEMKTLQNFGIPYRHIWIEGCKYLTWERRFYFPKSLIEVAEYFSENRRPIFVRFQKIIERLIKFWLSPPDTIKTIKCSLKFFIAWYIDPRKSFHNFLVFLEACFYICPVGLINIIFQSNKMRFVYNPTAFAQYSAWACVNFSKRSCSINQSREKAEYSIYDLAFLAACSFQLAPLLSVP